MRELYVSLQSLSHRMEPCVDITGERESILTVWKHHFHSCSGRTLTFYTSLFAACLFKEIYQDRSMWKAFYFHSLTYTELYGGVGVTFSCGVSGLRAGGWWFVLFPKLELVHAQEASWSIPELPSARPLLMVTNPGGSGTLLIPQSPGINRTIANLSSGSLDGCHPSLNN